MKIVLDTNVLLISIPRKSRYRPIFDALLNKKISLIISQDKLSEYVEIIADKATPSVANNVAELLLNLSNVLQVEIFYHWNLITEDKDDNKFVDATICGAAEFLVSNDKHFNVLAEVEFPPVKCISSEEFLERMSSV